MIIKSKRNKVIDRRLIPGNWFNVWLYKVLALWVSYSWCLCYTLWLGTIKATGSCIPAWEPYPYSMYLMPVCIKDSASGYMYQPRATLLSLS
jgi:hypothetical protein